MEKCSVQRFLLVTSDDFGYSEERDDGIIECYKSGAITGAVAMVNGISVATGVIKAKQAGMPLDLHMNLTEGLPVGPREGQYQTLVNEKGMFLGIQGFRDAVSRGDVDMAEVREEMIVQVQRFAELTGHTPVKVDGHQHFHTHPGIVNVYAEVLRQHDIKMSRVPLEEGAPLNAYKEFLVNVIEESKRCKNDFQANGIR
ncbi:carbohydrate deacetylase-like [Mya arenaria]|nr:carbohydrate deacetylase-like [Mya arenaria]